MIPGQKYFYPCNWLQILENTMDPVHTAFLHTIVSGAVFTDEFGVLPELEFAETPVGMIYIATRRVGDNIWARMVENVLPNLQQVAPIWENGQQPHPFSGPMMSRWIVPLDDTNTMLIEFRHVSETEGVVTPDWWADRGIMLPGQLAADTYEASQRQPGDFEAQVSQRPDRHPWPGASRRDRSRGHDVPQPDPQAGSGRSRPAASRSACSATAADPSRPIATTRSCACRRQRPRNWTRSCCVKPGDDWPRAISRRRR